MRLSEDELAALVAGNKSLKVHEYHPTLPPPRKERPTPPKREFDSLAEEVLYTRHIIPLMQLGEIVRCDLHPQFDLLSPVTVGNVCHRGRQYKPDFLIVWRSGQTQIIEVKGSKIKKLQRNYPLRRHLFLLKYAVPKGWGFVEIPAEDLTQGRFTGLVSPTSKEG